MSTELNFNHLVKQQVGRTAAARVRSSFIVGLGTGSTTVYAIQSLGERLQSGDLKDIKGGANLISGSIAGKRIRYSLNHSGSSRLD